MIDYINMRGVSLATEPGNGLKGNYYEPYVSGYVDEIENLADTYYFYFAKESRYLCTYYAKLTKEQRKEFRKERRKW